MSDEEGAVTDRITYDPYGAVTSREGSTETSFLYVGKWGIQSDDNGIVYMRARYYNADMKRFVNEDPIKDGMNWYVYAGNNPIMYADPSGLRTIALGGEASAAFILRLGLSGQIVVDDKGNIGLIGTGNGGGGTPAAAASAALTVTNASTIFDLEGIGFSGGGSYGIGADYIAGKAKDGSLVSGVQVVAFGVAVPLPEVHAELTISKVTSLNWLPKLIKDAIIDTANDVYDSLLTSTQKSKVGGKK